MKQFYDLWDADLHTKMCEAVAAVEGTRWDNVYIRRYNYSISASEGVMPDFYVTACFRSGKLKEGEYTMRWDARKERFVRTVVVRRKLEDHTVGGKQFVYSPLYQQVEPDYIDFAIAHVMRELGYRRHTYRFFVKAKGEKPKLFSRSCQDYNGNRRYYPCMENPRSAFYSPYKEGYLCAAPELSDIIYFCERFGIEPPYRNKQYVLEELIRVYRQRSGFTDAFRRYSHKI